MGEESARSPEVTLEVQRQVGRYRASIVRDLLEHDRVFAGYLASKTFRRVLGIATLPHADELARAREQVQFVCFEPLS